MSFITSRKGSLLLAALLVLTLLVYLLFHLLAPRVVQSTDDAYVHADFTLVAPKVAGFVQDVLVEDNQPVKAGQLLARLDDRDFRTALAAAEADVLGAEANLANAEANLQRQQALIEQARAKVRAEQAELVFARHEQSRYSRRTMAAPMPREPPWTKATLPARDAEDTDMEISIGVDRQAPSFRRPLQTW